MVSCACGFETGIDAYEEDIRVGAQGVGEEVGLRRMDFSRPFAGMGVCGDVTGRASLERYAGSR